MQENLIFRVFWRMSEETSQWIRDARRAVGTLMSLWKKRHVCRDSKDVLYEGIIDNNAFGMNQSKGIYKIKSE